MMDGIKEETVGYAFNVEVEVKPQVAPEVAEQIEVLSDASESEAGAAIAAAVPAGATQSQEAQESPTIEAAGLGPRDLTIWSTPRLMNPAESFMERWTLTRMASWRWTRTHLVLNGAARSGAIARMLRKRRSVAEPFSAKIDGCDQPGSGRDSIRRATACDFVVAVTRPDVVGLARLVERPARRPRIDVALACGRGGESSAAKITGS